MALGKNLKKQQLISDEKKKKPATKKKVQKKELIKSEKAPKKESGKKLANYISEKEQERRNQVRARQKESISHFEGIVQFVVFKVGLEEFAMDISRVKEVVIMPGLSEAPNTPKHVKGIASIRGKTFLALDLNLKFNKNTKKERRFLLAINDKAKSIAFMLEELPITLKVDGKNISSDLSTLDNTTKDVTYIQGIIQLDDRIIFYLDIDELIASDKAIVVPDEFVK